MKLVSILILILTLFIHNAYADNNLEFENWKKTFKAVALKNNISENTFNLVMSDVKFLPKVIEYDRYQPEFYEDTKTYISKRSSNKKVKKGVLFYKNQSELINKVEKKFDVEKELLLALMGIETNFGTYVGKMDILSSLATLSFDQRRSQFFTNELLILRILSKDLGKAFSREELSRILGFEQERTLDVCINRLRKKIEIDPKYPKYLKTKRGAGYLLWVNN